MKRSAKLLMLIGLLTDVHPSNAGNWTPLLPLADPSFGSTAASQSGRLFLMGGFDGQISASVSSWDGTVWGSAQPMSTPRLMAGAASAGGSVFAIGGFDGNGTPTATVERLDPVSGAWSGAAPMPMPRASFAAGAIGDSVFVAGGQGEDGLPMAEAFRFDPVAGVWSAIAPLPTPRTGVAGAVLERRLWVIGGMNGSPVATVERFDPATGAWSAGADLPEPLWFPAAGTLDGRVWVVGGMDASFQRSPRAYSAGSDGAWRAESSLPVGLAVAAVGSLGNCLVVASGMDDAGMPSAVAFSQCAATPPPPPPPPPPPSPADTLQVAVWLSPSSVNVTSQGQWVSVRVEPNGWAPTAIVASSLRLDGVAPDLSGPISFDDSDGDGLQELALKFPRAGFTDRPAGDYVLTLTGQRSDGTAIRGSAALTVQGSSLQANRRRSLRPLGVGQASGVEVSLDQAAEVRIDVLDLQGRRVERLYQGMMAAGQARLEWPRAGQTVARGTYFVRLGRPGAVDVVRIFVLH